MRRCALRDDQWDRIKDFLPGREGHVGGTAADNRLFVEAVLYRCRAGIPWRGLPERFGDWKIVHQRDNEYMIIDATVVRAHQHSAGDPPPLKWSDLRYVFDINGPLPLLGPGCWAFSSQSGQRGPHATDRSINLLGTLLPIAL